MKSLIPAALLLALPAVAQAQADVTAPAAPPVKSVVSDICVGGPKWGASFEESREVAHVPVPASFRALFESKAPCVRWALNTESIVTWHMMFGNEASIAPALAYLEQDYTRDIPAPAQYERALRKAYADAQPDLERAKHIEQPKGVNYSALHRFMDASPTISRLNALNKATDKYAFLGWQYLRAAEEFESRSLLSKAIEYLRPVISAEGFLNSLDEKSAFKGMFVPGVQDDWLRDVQDRAAILQAHLTRRPADLQAAEALLDAQYKPIFFVAATKGYSGGDDLCEFAMGYGLPAGTKEDCEANADDDLLTSYWINRAVLDFVDDKAEPDAWQSSYSLATRLLQFRQVHDKRRRYGRDTPDDDNLRLLMMRADYYARRFRSDLQQDPDEDNNWRAALGSLRGAERLARPDVAPARFKRIARQWLDLWNAAKPHVMRDSDRHLFVRSAELRRFADYLETNLNALSSNARSTR